MNLLAIKTFLKKSYAFIKNYWYVPLGLVVSAVTWFFYRQKAALMMDNLKKTRESHKKEVDVINNAHKKEVDARDEVVNKFVEENKILEAKLESKQEVISLETERKKRTHQNKEIEELAQALADSLTGGKK